MEQNRRREGNEAISRKHIEKENSLQIMKMRIEMERGRETDDRTSMFPKGKAPCGGAANIYFLVVGSMSSSVTICEKRRTNEKER